MSALYFLTLLFSDLQRWFKKARAKLRRTKAQDDSGGGGTVPPRPLSTGSPDNGGGTTTIQGPNSIAS